TPAPQPGEVIDAELINTNPNFPPKLKKITQPPAARSGGFQRDPKDTAQIVRQHSQHMAILWIATIQKEGRGPAEGEDRTEWLRKMIDWFHRDAENAQPMGGQS